MIYVAIAALVVAAGQPVVFTQLLRGVMRQQARERGLLINQVCALSGRPWEPPPADRYEVPVLEPEPTLFASPEQMTADDLEPVI